MAPASLAAVAAATLAASIGTAAGHGSLIWPYPRQSVDITDPRFAGGKWPGGHYDCHCTNGTNGQCDSAQSCLWFSQGCTIGCNCTGNGTASRLANHDECGSRMKATNNDPMTRTMNRAAVAGSPEDVYKFMPWRAPGSAVPQDPCGQAGGSGAHFNNGGEYLTTANAKLGDLGSKQLKPMPTGVIWKAGTVVHPSIYIKANHAGGWYYRLCKASDALSERCFEQTPLPFVAGAPQTIRYADKPDFQINATYLTEGTHPAGSTWAMNPIPLCCPNDGKCEKEGLTCGSNLGGGKCYGHSPCGSGKSHSPQFPWQPRPAMPPPGTPSELSIVDTVRLPADLAAGHYILGWRWDCEETAQVWSACADIEITAA